jgi:hypothetical protein
MSETGEENQQLHPVRDKIKRRVAAGTAAATFATTGLSFPAAPDFQKPQVIINTEVVHTTEHKTITNEYPEIYARLFSKDPEAGKLVDPSDVMKEYNIINNLVKAGYHIDKPISDIGVASDDDDTTINGIRTGGLGVHSEKNVNLGDLRGTTYKKLLDTVFDEHGIKPPDISTSGVEAVLGEKITLPDNTVLDLNTKSIQEDIKYLRKIAKQQGTSAGHLIDEYYGLAGNLPPGSEKLQGILDKLLRGKQEVIMTFNVTDETGHKIKVVHKTEKPPIWYVPIAELTEEFQPKNLAQENGAPRPQNIKADKGYGRAMEKIKQPRAYNYVKNERGTRFPHDQHRSGRRQRPNS